MQPLPNNQQHNPHHTNQQTIENHHKLHKKQLLQPHENSESTCSEQIDDDYEEQIEILGGPSTNQQLLLIKGVPGQMYQLNGSVLCSNRPLNNQVWQNFAQNLAIGMRKIQQKQIGYYIVGKKAPNNGKILILDSEVYKQRFYVDHNYILLLNLDKSEYKLNYHRDLGHLKMIQTDNSDCNLLLVLQGKRDKPIIQKTLAEDEQMYIPNAHVIAMSSTIFVRKTKKDRQIRLLGPGVVFMEPLTKLRIHPLIKNFIVQNVLMVLILIIITSVQYLMLT